MRVTGRALRPVFGRDGARRVHNTHSVRKMSKVYGLDKDRLYVTYYGGDPKQPTVRSVAVEEIDSTDILLFVRTLEYDVNVVFDAVARPGDVVLLETQKPSLWKTRNGSILLCCACSQQVPPDDEAKQIWLSSASRSMLQCIRSGLSA